MTTAYPRYEDSPYPPIFEGDDCPNTDHGHEFRRNAGRPFCVNCTITPRGLGAEREFALLARMREAWDVLRIRTRRDPVNGRDYSTHAGPGGCGGDVGFDATGQRAHCIRCGAGGAPREVRP